MTVQLDALPIALYLFSFLKYVSSSPHSRRPPLPSSPPPSPSPPPAPAPPHHVVTGACAQGPEERGFRAAGARGPAMLLRTLPSHFCLFLQGGLYPQGSCTLSVCPRRSDLA